MVFLFPQFEGSKASICTFQRVVRKVHASEGPPGDSGQASLRLAQYVAILQCGPLRRCLVWIEMSINPQSWPSLSSLSFFLQRGPVSSACVSGKVLTGADGFADCFNERRQLEICCNTQYEVVLRKYLLSTFRMLPSIRACAS